MKFLIANISAQVLADDILNVAVERDQGRPADDISIVVFTVSLASPETDGVRRLSVEFPVRVKRTF